MKKLREQLIALQSIPSETERAKESKVEMTKTAMKVFIATSLDMGAKAPAVQRALENLHTKDTDIIVDGDIYQWCIMEIQKQNAVRYLESSYTKDVPEGQPFPKLNFGKVVMQNSLLACHLLDCSDKILRSEYLSYPNSLSEVNKSEFLSLEGKEAAKDELFLESCIPPGEETKSSASNSPPSLSPKETDTWLLLRQNGAPVHQYLIAKGVTDPDNHVIYYMAFSSHQSLKEWNYGHISFEDGMLCLLPYI